MFLGLLQRRAEWNAAIAADARRLIESFNDHAYYEAREEFGAAASMAGARHAIGLPSSSRSLGAKGLRSASPVPTCARENFRAETGRSKTCEFRRRLKRLPIA